MAGDHDESIMLHELASHRHVIEILDLVSESGCNTALLMRFVPAPPADLASALGLLATYGLLATDRENSCDDPLTITGTLRLTDRGEAVAQALSFHHSCAATATDPIPPVVRRYADRASAVRALLRRLESVRMVRIGM
ncbi:hypothetical protein [Nocardia sp. NPDC020380]|uniref:hypothetical protein n=1 Tax=Nocardia sp. NPDC020380 TaxID=3364309 RepID=UPI0037B5E982